MTVEGRAAEQAPEASTPAVALIEPVVGTDIPSDVIDGGLVLLVGFADPDLPAAVAAAAETRGIRCPGVVRLDSTTDAGVFMESRHVRVLALGEQLDPQLALDFFRCLGPEQLYGTPAVVLVGAYDPLALQSLVQDDDVYFFSKRPLPSDQLAEILLSGCGDVRQRMLVELAAFGRSSDRRVVVTRRLMATGENLLQLPSLEALEEPIVETLGELIGPISGRLWLYDQLSHTLRATHGEDEEVSTVAGITSYVARTGLPARVEKASEDPRYDPEADAAAEARLLAVPISSSTGTVLGVLALNRADEETPFSAEDQEIAVRLAQETAARLIYHVRPVYSTRQQELSRQVGDSEIFRPEALEANDKNFTEAGRLLRHTAGWTGWTWWILLSGILLPAVLGLLIPIHEYAEGPIRVSVRQGIVADQEPTAEAWMVADLPIRFAPQLKKGLPMRVILDGYADQPLTLELSQISGQSRGETRTPQELTARESTVRVAARADSLAFGPAQGLTLVDGLRGQGQVRLRSKPLLVHLFPRLGAVWGGTSD